MEKTELIRKINDEVDIVSLVSEYVNLEKFGNGFKGLCPFHDEKTPSFSVSPEKKIAFCFGCKQGGHAVKFFQQIEKISLDDAIIRLAKKYGIKADIKPKKYKNPIYSKFENIMNEVTDFYQYNLDNSKQGLEAIKYLEKRKIDKKMQEYLKIGLAPKENTIQSLFSDQGIDYKNLTDLGLMVEKGKNEYYDLFRNRIIFPIQDEEGLIVGFSGRIYYESNEPKYLNSPESIIFKKREVLYNFYHAKDEIKKNNFVYLVEGFMDVIAFLKAGIRNVVCTMGTGFTDEHLKLVKKWTNNLVVCFDGDNAGKEATLKLVNNLERNDINIEIVTLTNNMDPDEYLLKYGESEFLKFLNENKKDKYDYLFDELKKEVNENNVLELEEFKGKIFSLIRPSKSMIIINKYLQKLAEFLNIDLEIIQNDYNSLVNLKPKPKPNKTTTTVKNNIMISRYLESENRVTEYMMFNKDYAYAIDSIIKDVVDMRNLDVKMKIIDYYETHDTFDRDDFLLTVKDDLKDYILSTLSKVEEFNPNEAQYFFEELKLYSDKLRCDEIEKMILQTSSIEEKIALKKEKMELLKKLRRN